MTVAALVTKPLSGTWFRAIDPRFSPTALATTHTRTIPSRFSDASPSRPSFEILYLAENHQVALFEVGALYGSPTTPGGLIAHPRATWSILNVTVSLSHVVDLSDPLAQKIIGMSAQELTGDWRGYRQRGPFTSVPLPVGTAPTQQLGAVINADPRYPEGFLTLSAKIPYHLILAIFPNNMRRTSHVEFVDQVGSVMHRIPGKRP